MPPKILTSCRRSAAGTSSFTACCSITSPPCRTRKNLMHMRLRRSLRRYHPSRSSPVTGESKSDEMCETGVADFGIGEHEPIESMKPREMVQAVVVDLDLSTEQPTRRAESTL